MAGMDLVLLLGYVALLAAAYAKARSTAWLVIMVTGVGGLAGALINFALDRGHDFTRQELQLALMTVLVLVVLLAWLKPLGFAASGTGSTRGTDRDLGVRRQLVAIGVPIVLILVGFLVITSLWTEKLAFLRPVSFLIGNGVAEDNAKWLDFSSQWASGAPIEQAVPLGGPLALLLTFIGTAMAVLSQVTLGGFNEVAVAANTIVYGEYAMVALVLFALAPLAETRIHGSRLPAPAIWLGMAVLAAATLVVIKFGHLTLQFTILVVSLWSATFLSGIRMRRARLITSLAVAASMTVWLPLNVVAIVVCFGWLVVLVGRGLRGGAGSFDLVGLAMILIVSLGIFQPVVSSVTYTLGASATFTSPMGAGAGVTASFAAALVDSPLFAASGGTEAASILLSVLAGVSVLSAAAYLVPGAGPLRTSLIRRFIPIGVISTISLIIYVLDFWTTGGGPNYGSMKFSFMVVIAALATTLPLALVSLDASSGARMTQLRWIGAGVVVALLMIDSLLPRAIAQARPQLWSPPIPFNNTSGSYWWPADVNDSSVQTIASNPVACVYLPPGASVPSAIVPSGLSDAQRVYACSRLLAGLSGMDTAAQPIVEWLRREWLTNTPAWDPSYEALIGLDPEVLGKNVILLDEGSNVVGVETLSSLLERFPKTAGQ
jgi:hypothetical protein